MASFSNVSLSTISPDLERALAEKFNDEMRSTVLPVTVFVGMETVFGFFGNMLVLYVFLLHYHKCNFKYFVLCLSFIDTTSTLTTLPGEIVTQTFWFVYPVPLVCKIKSFFNVFTVCGSALGLLLIAVDRYRKVCRPLQWQIKPKIARILIFILLGISCIIAIPVAFFWGTHSIQKAYEEHNITLTICEIDARYLGTNQPLEYSAVIEALLGISMFILFILYMFVVRKLLTMKVKDKTKPTSPENSKSPQGIGVSWRIASDDDNSGKSQTIEAQDTADSSVSRSADNVCDETMTIDGEVPADTKPKQSSTLKAKRATSARLSRRTKIRRKTLIMFILTAVFIFTTILYLTCLSFIAHGILETLTSVQKSVYFFFFRLYFINHVINPILYGILDPKFRRVIKQTFQCCKNRCFGQKPFHIKI